LLTGKVSEVTRGMVCLELEDDCRCWFQPLSGCTVGVGDVVTGNLLSSGGEQVFNRTRRCTMRVFIQDRL
jgi:hypothetical protein